MSSGFAPHLLVVSGPNGSGKSTFLAQLIAGARELPDLAMPERVLNPDEFARVIDPLAPDRVRLDAGRAVLLQRAALLAEGSTFAIETTLSGRSELRLLADARRTGYRIVMVYIATSSAAQNILRVELRRSEQNRSVAPTDVMRRYARSLHQVARAARYCDVTSVYDNTGSAFVELMTLRAGRIVSLDRTTTWSEAAFAAELAVYRERHHS